MSGICGIVALDGSEVTAAHVAAMTALLERRGPDGTHHWRRGHVALGHTLLATTPEALHETLPLTDPQSGCTITADVRLDNREELFEALRIDARGRVIGDGELILHAYLRWGEDCPRHLLGDFAFAIWDPRAGRLFCARDHMGLRQLIYCHVPGKVFAFATEPRAVLTHPQVPKRINEGRIADFLEGYLEGADFTSTFFDSMLRLPPAHSLAIDSNALRIVRYWELEPGPELKLDSDEAYAAAFLEVFTEAVLCRLRSAKPVGSMMSGGLDSNSVVAVANGLLASEGRGPLKTFSAIGPDPETCSETRTIRLAAKAPGLDPHFVSFSDLDDISRELLRLTVECDDPFDAHMVLPRAVYLAAKGQGVNVMLDGVAADVLLAPGGVVSRLIRKWQIPSAWREAIGEERFWTAEQTWATWTRWTSFGIALRQAVTPDWLRGLREWIRHFSYGRPSGDLLDRTAANRFNLAERVAIYRTHDSFRRLPAAKERARTLRQAWFPAARERYDRVAAAVAIEPRDPFLDLRVIAYCLSLPDRQLQADGWPKVIMRRALAGALPDEVRWRPGKTHLGWTFSETLIGGSIGGWDEVNNSASETMLELDGPFGDLARHWQTRNLSEDDIYTGWQLSNWLTRFREAMGLAGKNRI